jgi:hypothetical protein
MANVTITNGSRCMGQTPALPELDAKKTSAGCLPHRQPVGSLT